MQSDIGQEGICYKYRTTFFLIIPVRFAEGYKSSKYRPDPELEENSTFLYFSKEILLTSPPRRGVVYKSSDEEYWNAVALEIICVVSNDSQYLSEKCEYYEVISAFKGKFFSENVKFKDDDHVENFISRYQSFGWKYNDFEYGDFEEFLKDHNRRTKAIPPI